ncbi:hypothetical protein ABZ061_28760 [Streptomyces mutabilis]|uniref:hypothetical protein n=1 Tax=Streptomyces mutabilis TaxID=67332 RepID=UPI0033B52432
MPSEPATNNHRARRSRLGYRKNTLPTKNGVTEAADDQMDEREVLQEIPFESAQHAIIPSRAGSSSRYAKLGEYRPEQNGKHPSPPIVPCSTAA